MVGMPHVSAARSLPAALLAALTAAAAAPAQVAQPTVALLSPGNGTLVEGE
jgi:hypothetical protein